MVLEFKQKMPDALGFNVSIDELRKFPSLHKMEFRQVEVAIERVAHLKLRVNIVLWFALLFYSANWFINGESNY